MPLICSHSINTMLIHTFHTFLSTKNLVTHHFTLLLLNWLKDEFKKMHLKLHKNLRNPKSYILLFIVFFLKCVKSVTLAYLFDKQ